VFWKKNQWQISRGRIFMEPETLIPDFFDTHAHLDYPDFAGDLGQVIERARAAGISRIITIGTDMESSRRALRLADEFPGVYAAVGWHPGHASEAPGDIREPLRELARHPKVVAIGETGLDFYRLPGKSGGTAEQDAACKEKQASLFQQQLEVAAELGLNCVIHQREAFEETLQQLEPFSPGVRGVFHCFVDSPDAMRRIVALGSLVSFTGILTFRNAQTVRDTLQATPLNAFMLETDSPFLAPMPYRGKRCEPAYVKEIANIAAQAKGVSLTELAEITCATARDFFRGLN
jgi:TatD DNase family protein